MKQEADTPPQAAAPEEVQPRRPAGRRRGRLPAADRTEARLFFRLVSYRYQRGTTLITTNKSVKDWPEILAGVEAPAAALLDRLLHRCHVLNIRGRPYRLRDRERMMK